MVSMSGKSSDDWLGSFLDDIYIVTTAARARACFDTVTVAVRAHAGVDANFGKCRVWSASGGGAPPGIAELGPDVWRGVKDAEENGLKVLDAPWALQPSSRDF